MPKYRLVEIKDSNESIFKIQRRFLWWYNPDNIDAYVDGIYSTKEKAMEAYASKTSSKDTQITITYLD